jgi:hypothetical protein
MPDGSLMKFEDYQKQNKLSGAQIAHNFYYTEPKFTQDIQDYKELIVCHKLMRVLDTYRNLKNAPININSFNRSESKQKQLQKDGFKAAKTSPHVVKLAADCDTLTEKETLENVKMVQEAAKITDIKVRIGYQEYLNAGQTFIHIDVCPEYYAKGRIWYLKPHPIQWEREITW